MQKLYWKIPCLVLSIFFEEKHQKTHQVNLNKNLKLLIQDFENEINFLNKSDMEVEGRESTNEISETQEVTNDKIEAEQTQRETEERIETANTTSNRSQNENRQNTKNNIRKNWNKRYRRRSRWKNWHAGNTRITDQSFETEETIKGIDETNEETGETDEERETAKSKITEKNVTTSSDNEKENSSSDSEREERGLL